MFRLSEHLDKQIKSYPRDETKICIIAALIHQPPLWVLDEPMMGLDPQSTVQIVRQMREHCQKGNTVFFSSHNLDGGENLRQGGDYRKGKLHTIIDLHQKGNKETLEETFLKITAFEEDYE